MTMEFFDRMRALTDKLCDPQSCSRTTNFHDPLNEELGELQKYLSMIYKRLHTISSSSRQNGDSHSPGNLSRILINTHSILEGRLRMIEREDKKNHSPRTKLRIWDPNLLDLTAENIRIENHKLRALLCTFNPDNSVQTAIHPNFYRWRSQKIEHYIKLEIRRCGRNRREVNGLDSQNNEFKWKKLHNVEYLSHISEDEISAVSSRSWDEYIHYFTRNLQIAQDESLDPSDRWIHLMICSHYLMCARNSKEYREFHTLFNHPNDSSLIETGFTLHHYLVELEVLLFGILTELETEYLNPNIVQERSTHHHSQPPSPLIPKRDSESEDSSQLPSIDEYGVIFKCRLGEEQAGHVLKLRLDANGALTLDFDEDIIRWPVGFQVFREIDLRHALIRPSYLVANYYSCELILKSKSLTGRLTFQSLQGLTEFQRKLTGYKVFQDFKTKVQIRFLKKLEYQSRNSITGRLQIWLRDLGNSLDANVTGINRGLTRAGTSHSAMSRTTLASIATQRVQQAISVSQLTSVDDNTGLIIEKPVAPLILMFVDISSQDQNIKPGHILAFKYGKAAKLDRKKCKPDDKYPRCFVIHAARVDLEIGRGSFPINPKELSWVEVTFINDSERETFTKQLEAARAEYDGRMRDYNRGVKFMHAGHHNTAAYSVE